MYNCLYVNLCLSGQVFMKVLVLVSVQVWVRDRDRERERERERAYMCDEKTVPTRVAENITSYFP